VERDEIERQDFPSARRGYDTAAVNEHLRRVADEFEALERAAADRPAAGSLAEGASTSVRAILEAAEASAQQLRDEAGGHVARVEESVQAMLTRLGDVQTELDSLRSTAESVVDSLQELSRDVATGGAGRSEAAAPAPAAPAANGSRSTDEAGARLVALNMALEGAPRDEAGRYLSEHYDVPDVEALLDDVYTSAGR
jgi:DivIVA domain-containing protein